MLGTRGSSYKNKSKYLHVIYHLFVLLTQIFMIRLLKVVLNWIRGSFRIC
ncbi:hypothetical protein Hanom_Chr05g00473411 [Helianthus anomalus]